MYIKSDIKLAYIALWHLKLTNTLFTKLKNIGLTNLNKK